MDFFYKTSLKDFILFFLYSSEGDVLPLSNTSPSRFFQGCPHPLLLCNSRKRSNPQILKPFFRHRSPTHGLGSGKSPTDTGDKTVEPSCDTGDKRLSRRQYREKGQTCHPRMSH